MNIQSIINYSSEVVWLLPIFRQWKTKWIYYFLILGLLDPLVQFTQDVLHETGDLLFTIGSVLLYLSLFKVEGKKLKESDYFLFLLLVFALFLIQKSEYFILFAHLIIFYKILSFAVIDLHTNDRINISFLVLVLYELSMVFTYMLVIDWTPERIVPAYIALAAEMGVAVFFTIFRSDSPKLLIYLNNSLKESLPKKQPSE